AQEDHGLTDRLLAEMPGILLWAIAGWQRLQERGRFRQPQSGEELLAELEELSSPVAAFVRECCCVAPSLTVSVEEIYGRWKEWCTQQGRDKPGTAAVFGRDLLAVVPTVQKIRPRQGEERYRAYQGIGLIPKPAASPFAGIA